MDHSNSYILRHWRGELSLARSFWVNCILVSVIFALLMLAPVDSFISHWPRLVAGGTLALYLASIPLTVWQCVGTWRSAQTRAAGGRRFWARVVQSTVATDVAAGIYSTISVILPISLDYGQIALGLDPFGDYRVSVSDDGRNLVVDGGIGFGLADTVTEALDRNRGLRTIELWSPGGRIAEARRLAEIVEARALDTLVVDTCASACTLVFVAGNRRELASEARLGFHNGAVPGATEAEARLWQIVDQEYLLRRGVSRDFVRRIYATPFEELWEPSQQELLRAGVATGYAMAGG